MTDGEVASLSSSAGDSSDGAEDWEQGGDGYSVEYSLWMLKFLCPKEGCGGTLAPPTTTAVVMEASHASAPQAAPCVLCVLTAPRVLRSATTAATSAPMQSSTKRSRTEGALLRAHVLQHRRQ